MDGGGISEDAEHVGLRTVLCLGLPRLEGWCMQQIVRGKN